MIARREEEKPKVVENRYVIQVPKNKIKNIKKKTLQSDYQIMIS